VADRVLTAHAGLLCEKNADMLNGVAATSACASRLD
jgi:hypothetical protein